NFYIVVHFSLMLVTEYCVQNFKRVWSAVFYI
ncbi:hypothetical protein Tsp_08873, partial [Trichinella spiralis]